MSIHMNREQKRRERSRRLRKQRGAEQAAAAAAQERQSIRDFNAARDEEDRTIYGRDE